MEKYLVLTEWSDGTITQHRFDTRGDADEMFDRRWFEDMQAVKMAMYSMTRWNETIPQQAP